MRLLPRRTGGTTLAILAAFAGVFMLIHLLAPQWARTVGLDVWEMDTAVARCRHEGERKRELDDVMEHLSAQFAASDAVVLALIEDRIAFDAAVEEMDEINRDRTELDDVLQIAHSRAHTHEERIARYTIAKVQARLATDPARLAEVTARLEAAYECEIAH
jgi:hypothetical protein